MKKSYLLAGVTAGLMASQLASADNPAVIPLFFTPQVNGPIAKTATLDGCATTDGKPITISWSAQTTSDINVKSTTVDINNAFIDEESKMNLTLAGQTLLNVAAPSLGGSCTSCAKTTGPINLQVDETFSAPGIQAIFSDSVVVNPGNPIYDALAGGGSASVSFDPQANSSFRNWSGNVEGGVITQSTASVSCSVQPPSPPPPPPPVPAISLVGMGALGAGLSGLGALLGFRRRK